MVPLLDRRELGRQRILEGAAHILDAGALDDFTVDSLARNLHMSKSTLYKYFDSKDHVVIALVEAACQDTMRSLDALDLSAQATAMEALDHLIEVLADHSDRVPAAITLAFGRLPPEASRWFVDIRVAVRDRIRDLLLRGERAGEFSVPNPTLAATAYQAALEDVVVAAARGEGELTRGDALRAIHQMISRGIMVPTA